MYAEERNALVGFIRSNYMFDKSNVTSYYNGERVLYRFRVTICFVI